MMLPKKASISLVMIVKDEESILEKCLESVYQIADEIIIVDTGSTDNTVKIAQKFTKNIQNFDWIDDFSAARNFADTFATKDYILRWDGDWILRDGDIKKLQQLKNNGFNNADLIEFNWILEFTTDLEPKRMQQLFFFFKNNEFHWELPIHNELVPNNKIPKKILSIPQVWVYHHKDPEEKTHRYHQTLEVLQKSLAQMNPANPHFVRQKMMLAQSYSYLDFNQKAIDCYTDVLQKGLKDIDTLGFIVDKMFLEYLKLGQIENALTLIQSRLDLQNRSFRFDLCKAEGESLKGNYTVAIELLKDYSKKYSKHNLQTGFDIDLDRFIEHPKQLLSKLLAFTKNE
jgi:glycosyltransferase involved in cell wall biosynthesis